MAQSFKERLYDRAPVFVQNLMISAQGAIFKKQRFGDTFWDNLARAEARGAQSKDALAAYQLERLREFLTHAQDHSPYYTAAFKATGVDPRAVKTLADLRAFPILEKETLRQRTDDIRARCYTKKGLLPVHTSGTTGTPISVGYIQKDMQERFALLYRMLRHFGVEPFDRSVRFSGRTLFPGAAENRIFWRINKPNNQLLMSSYDLKPEHFDDYVKKLIVFEPVMIDGYPSSIFVLARHINATGQQGKITPKFIMTTAETLEDYQRAEIKQAFGGCAIGNQYASSEGAPFITEDRAGDLVINTDTGVFEFVRPGTDIPAQPGEIGEMLVTSFTTHAYPLIRYRIGDTVELTEPKLAATMAMPTVKQIMGRQEDILFTPEKGFVGRLDTVFKAAPPTLVETQIVQTGPMTMDLNVVPDKDRFAPEHLDGILFEMRQRLGDVAIIVNYYDSLPRGKNGKLRAVIGMKP